MEEESGRAEREGVSGNDDQASRQASKHPSRGNRNNSRRSGPIGSSGSSYSPNRKITQRRNVEQKSISEGYFPPSGPRKIHPLRPYPIRRRKTHPEVEKNDRKMRKLSENVARGRIRLNTMIKKWGLDVTPSAPLGRTARKWGGTILVKSKKRKRGRRQDKAAKNLHMAK